MGRWGWKLRKTAGVTAILTLLLTGPGFHAAAEYGQPPVAAQSVREMDCQEAVALLKAQDEHLSREFRRIQRDLAALNERMERPGFREAAAGIGYILGLFGIAFYIHARKHGSKG